MVEYLAPEIAQMDILRLLEQLNGMIEGPPHFGPITWGLNRDEITMHIAKIRASLPQELKVAVSTVRESERIIDTAREDATSTLGNARREAERIVNESRHEAQRIVEEAKLQQERMVAESEILKLTKAQSEEIRNSADRDSLQMKRGAEKYAYDVLTQLEGVVGKVMTTIERGKHEIQKNDAPTPAQPREKARV
jgi:cell division septum initiation protein DivIVA